MLPMFAMLFSYPFKLNPWLEFSLATVIQFVIGARFYRGAWTSLKNKQANMDTLVALGTSAAYFYSCYVLLFINGVDRHVYFESSAVVITFVTIGKW
jgi:Cu+-exporting ATPase